MMNVEFKKNESAKFIEYRFKIKNILQALKWYNMSNFLKRHVIAGFDIR